MTKFCAAVVFCTLPLLPGCASTEAEVVTEAAPTEEPYKHSGTKIAFPAGVGEFERVRVSEFDGNARDVAIGYQCRTLQGDIDVTLYLSPGLGLYSSPLNSPKAREQRAEFVAVSMQKAKEGMLLANPEATVESEGPSTLLPGRDGLGLSLVSPRQSAFAEKTVRLDAHMFVLGWGSLLKVRANYPVDLGEDAMQKVKAFLATFDLPSDD